MAYRPTGYQASAQSVTFSGTQTLASLLDGEFSDLSDAIDNSSTKYAFADLQLGVASIAMTAEGTVSFYLVPSVDGTNYGTYTGNTTDAPENEQYYVGSCTTLDTTAAMTLVLRDVELPNGFFKLGVKNGAGVSFAASGNALSWRPHSGEDA